MPLTRPQPGSSALPDNWRVSHPGPAFVPFWRQSLAGDWPYVGFPAGQLGPAGIGVLYAVAVASAAAYFLAAGGQPQWPTLLIAAGTFVVWWMAVAAAVAATRVRWHAGGYATGLALVSWHAMVYVALRTFFPSQDVAADVRLGGLLFADLALIIILGINAWQFILSMLALLSMKERAVVARALTELRRCWVSCRMPNPIAMVSVHPRLSLVLFGGCGTVLLSAVIREEALRPPYTGGGAILVLCYTLLVLIWWSVCWQDAIYRFVRGQLRPDV